MRKICVDCNREQDITMFNVSVVDSKGKVYHRPQCRECYNIKLHHYRATHKEVIKKYNNTEYAKFCRKRYRDTHKEESKIYKIEHRDEINANQRKHNKTEKRRAYNRIYKKKKRQENLNYKIYSDIKRRINLAIGDSNYCDSAIFDLLGCNIEFLKEYLSGLFTSGMNWENHSLHGWHIDHILPCASFDMTDVTQRKKCFHYTNLQPLWAKDNLSKGAKILVA